MFAMKNYSFNAPTLFEFEIKNLSEITQSKRQISGVPHRTDFYQIILIESGGSTQFVDFTPINVAGGQILFIAKNQVVSFDTSSSYSGKAILFTDVFFNRCDSDIRLIKQLDLFNPFTGNAPVSVNEKLATLCKMMEDEFACRRDNLQQNILHSYLSAFLTQATRQREQVVVPLKSGEYNLALQFAELVEQHHKSLRKVNDYLELMNTTAKSLSKSLHAAVCKTPKQFIDDRILLEAKRLLVYNGVSVKEIAFELGFDEPTNFSKFFREQTGMSPAEFKKQHIP